MYGTGGQRYSRDDSSFSMKKKRHMTKAYQPSIRAQERIKRDETAHALQVRFVILLSFSSIARAFD